MKKPALPDFRPPMIQVGGVQTMDINAIKKIDITLKVKSIKPDQSFSEKRKKSKSEEKEEEKKKNQIDLRV